MIGSTTSSFKRTFRKRAPTLVRYHTLSAFSIPSPRWIGSTSRRLAKKLPVVADNYDMHFAQDVPFGRHAMAIDE